LLELEMLIKLRLGNEGGVPELLRDGDVLSKVIVLDAADSVDDLDPPLMLR
jgi:hypothetical protein